MIDKKLINNLHIAMGNPRGKCYIVSEALYHLSGGKFAGLKAKRGVLNNVIHWWIEDSDGNIYDLTADQFDFRWPYAEGKGAGFFPNMKRETCALIKELDND